MINLTFKLSNIYLKVQEIITLTIGSSIDLLFPGSGSKHGFEHSTYKNIKIGNEMNMTSILNKGGLFAYREYRSINLPSENMDIRSKKRIKGM